MQIASTHDLKGVKGELKRIFFFHKRVANEEMFRGKKENKQTDRKIKKHTHKQHDL